MEVTVRVEVHYCTPPDTVLGDILRLLHSRTWAAFMIRHIRPRLEKVSPVDTSVLKGLEQQWQVQAEHRKHVSTVSENCVICMDTDEGDVEGAQSRHNNVLLPCGHGFHHHCIHSWLQLQSTCPICRWQFPKEFAGGFVVRWLQSTAVLPEHIRAWPRASIARAPIGGHPVRIVVSLTLEKTIVDTPFGHVPSPCEITGLILDESSGELFSELDSQLSAVPCHPETQHHQIASTRFASVEPALEESKFSDGQVSSSVARGTGKRRRCFRRQTETNKRQRVGSEYM
ncbi:E3 ubiquitin-protein ligase hrd-1 [Phytophthora citrophthora]|uniref:E3 ubiquitin-protein ligase hrd-1 n=1 Tax=Phytophthora citrophthora TaxID=4793 RepID=A0AAD9G456_9STRA|nr:E3 ubiquitin-protein ligase hrd-1 [Phytophthora citrophthora]